MAYSVTGIRATPDVGFQSGHRHTAEGARELATHFVAEGLLEIEVRDPRGNLCSFADLDSTAEVDGAEERAAARRLSALA